MSTKLVASGWVDESWRQDEALQEMYVSLLGPEVWRNYRTLRVPTAMILDLYKPQAWDELHTGLMATLHLALATGRFDGVTGLAAYIRTRVDNFAQPYSRMFYQQGRLAVHEHAPFDLFGVAAEDKDLTVVLQLVAIMLTCMTNDNHIWFVNYCAEIWFDICDVALRGPFVFAVVTA